MLDTLNHAFWEGGYSATGHKSQEGLNAEKRFQVTNQPTNQPANQPTNKPASQPTN